MTTNKKKYTTTMRKQSYLTPQDRNIFQQASDPEQHYTQEELTNQLVGEHQYAEDQDEVDLVSSTRSTRTPTQKRVKKGLQKTTPNPPMTQHDESLYEPVEMTQSDNLIEESQQEQSYSQQEQSYSQQEPEQSQSHEEETSAPSKTGRSSSRSSAKSSSKKSASGNVDISKRVRESRDKSKKEASLMGLSIQKIRKIKKALKYRQTINQLPEKVNLKNAIGMVAPNARITNAALTILTCVSSIVERRFGEYIGSAMYIAGNGKRIPKITEQKMQVLLDRFSKNDPVQREIDRLYRLYSGPLQL